MLEIFSVHNEIGTYHFHEIWEGREIWRQGCRTDRSQFHRIIWREVAFHFIGSHMLHSTVMTLTSLVGLLPITHVLSTLTECFVAHSDKRCPVSKSFFTHSSKCYSSSFSITWPFLFAPAQFHLTSVLTRVKFVCQPHAFSNDLEYHLELLCHHFFVYIGGRSSEYALS